MKNIHIILSTLVLALVINSCASNDDDTVLIPFEIAAEFNTMGENEIKIIFESSETLSILNPTLSLTIYGYDEFLADAPATIITTQHYEVTELPYTAVLRYPSNPHTQIMPESPEESAKYFLELLWDSDDNNQRCTGDIGYNYEENNGIIILQTDSIQSIPLTTFPETAICQ